MAVKLNPINIQALQHAAEILRYHNKIMEINQMQKLLDQEKLRIKRLEPIDPDKGNNVDTYAYNGVKNG